MYFIQYTYYMIHKINIYYKSMQVNINLLLIWPKLLNIF